MQPKRPCMLFSEHFYFHANARGSSLATVRPLRGRLKTSNMTDPVAPVNPAASPEVDTEFEEPPPPPSHNLPLQERDQLQATELAQVRSNYQRASSNRLQGTGNPNMPKRSTNPVALLVYNVKKFWRHQISITVPHEACRDHLGTLEKI